MIEVCLATNNAHKVKELQQLLGSEFIIKTMQEIGCNDDIEESGSTLEENSLIKAKYIFDKYGINTIADDSGLEVKALNNEPGVYSARYAGEHGNHDANMTKLLQNLEDKIDRSARFRAVITFILNTEIHQFEGVVTGNILHQKQGNGGFGYDPIFQPSGYLQSFAEMSDTEKNLISHRAEAIKKLEMFTKKNNG